jgi:hypothetical protein
LLWHCLFLQSGDADTAAAKLSDVLGSKDGVFQASTLRFGTYANAPLIATQTPIVGSLSQHTDLLKEQFHPNGRAGKYSRLVLNGGPFKDRLEKHNTYHAPEVTWDGIGNPTLAADLLNFFVHSVGLEANRGFGSVGRFTWETLETDTSWIDEDGKPARVLPETAWSTIAPEGGAEPVRAPAQCIPPYRNEKNLPCVIPERIRRIRLKQPV